MTLNDITGSPLVLGGGFMMMFGFIIAMFRKVPEILFRKLRNIFIFRVVVYDYDELFFVIEDWLAKTHQNKYRSIEASYEKTGKWVSGISDSYRYFSREKRLHYKQEPNIFSIKYKGKRLIIEKTKKELENARDMKSALNFHYIISAWRGKLNIQGFLEEITKNYNDSLVDGRISIYAPETDSWSIASRKQVKTLDKVIMKSDVKSFLMADLERFTTRRSWYQDTSITYKRGYLLYGPGGTGKTTLAQAMAAHTNKDVYIMNLNSVKSDSMLISLFSRLPDNSLLLIEDVDCAFVQRESASKEGKITFSCLLNCLDGVISKEGVITVMTTNHIERLDPALIRTGRMDVKLEMPLATNNEIEEYIKVFYAEDFKLPEYMQIGMSAVQEICIQNSSATLAVEALIKKHKESLVV